MSTRTLAEIVADVQAGMATLTGLSTGAVSDNDWRVQRTNVSCFVAPSLRGSQRREFPGCHTRTHQIAISFRVRAGKSVDAFSTIQALIDLVCDWFVANDDLTNTVETTHAEPLTWESPEETYQDGDIAWRELNFVATVWVKVE